MPSEKAAREIAHGRMLSESDPEQIWGWSTPAGQRRAIRRADLIIAGAQLGRGSRVLEIGCGTGMFTEMFAATGATIVAVDVSADLLERAVTRKLPVDRVKLVLGRFEELALDEPYDAAIGSSVLHHLDLDPALENIHRLLKPGGTLSFAEPNMLNPQVFLERHPGPFGRLFYYVSPDETAFVRWALAARLEQRGFTDVPDHPIRLSAPVHAEHTDSASPTIWPSRRSDAGAASVCRLASHRRQATAINYRL